MSEAVTLLLLFLGTAFLLLAAVGLLRFPDVYSRMQAATKASTLGIGLVLAGTAYHYSDSDVASRAVLAILFIFLTAPVSAHMIGRAAYFVGSPLWKETFADELRDKYDRQSHELEGASDRETEAPGSGEASSESRTPK